MIEFSVLNEDDVEYGDQCFRLNLMNEPNIRSQILQSITESEEALELKNAAMEALVYRRRRR